MGRKKKSKNSNWLIRQKRDEYVRRARLEGYRSRAAYKLEQLHQKDKLFKPGDVVLDLGASPGSWSQFAARQIGPNGRVVAVDLLPMKTLAGVDFLQGDIARSETQLLIKECLGLTGADLVISDVAPNISGIRDTDQAQCIELAEKARNLALGVLKANGRFVVKIFEGELSVAFREQTRAFFDQVLVRKPGASRSESREVYIVALRPTRRTV